MSKIKTIKVNEKEIRDLTDQILAVGLESKCNPVVFLAALKIAEGVIRQGLEDAIEECDCENCVADRKADKKKVITSNYKYKETLH